MAVRTNATEKTLQEIYRQYGLRDPMNFFIRYICQKDYQDDGTHYGTMFDRQFGIPVYSAYTLTEDKVDFKERTRPKWKQTQGIYSSFR